jgi:hypothetical protein
VKPSEIASCTGVKDTRILLSAIGYIALFCSTVYGIGAGICHVCNFLTDLQYGSLQDSIKNK